MNADGLILAGGKSTRMHGFHKGNLLYDEKTFVERLILEMKKEVQNIWISYGEKIQEEYIECRVVQDQYLECGPIGGLHAGLEKSANEWIFVAACDMPFLRIELYQFLRDFIEEKDRVVVPVMEGKVHPLAAVYRKDFKQIVEKQILSGNYKIMDLLKREDIHYVDVSDYCELCQMLRNINTMDQYEKLVSNKA